jgi:hypothetical protein
VPVRTSSPLTDARVACARWQTFQGLPAGVLSEAASSMECEDVAGVKRAAEDAQDGAPHAKLARVGDEHAGDR